MNYIPREGAVAELPLDYIKDGLHYFDETIDKIQKDVPVNIFEILGMRNLSAFVGEVFAAEVRLASNGSLEKNPHQDGYPDLLLMDDFGRGRYEELKERGELYAKGPFSPFAGGGIEVKATCGSVPSPKVLARRGLSKPQIGEERIPLLTGYDWKAHHRETNNLLSIIWDFREGAPRITAVFFCAELTEDDWGQIVQPREGGGRTTSVSIMPRHGVAKMYCNWVAVIEDERWVRFLDERNGGSRLGEAAGLHGALDL